MWLDQLIEMKRRCGKTLSQISDTSGVSLGTVNKIFAGQTSDPKLETIKAIVHCLGGTLDDLFIDDPAPETKKAPALEDGDEEMLELYHQLNRDGRLVAQGEVRALLREDRYRKDAQESAG